MLRNASQAAGNLGGGLAGAAGRSAARLARLSQSLELELVLLLVVSLEAWAGSGLGSNIGGGVYDMFNNTSPQERARKELVDNANVQRSIAADDLKSQLVIQDQVMALRRNDDFERQARDLKVQNEYNYANSINQAMINAQQNASMQQLAIAQAMMG